MPTVLRWKGYRFFFYSADGWVPAHVHVWKDGKEAKIWLHDIAVAANLGYNSHQIGEISRAVREHRAAFMEAWDDHFANRN